MDNILNCFDIKTACSPSALVEAVIKEFAAHDTSVILTQNQIF